VRLVEPFTFFIVSVDGRVSVLYAGGARLATPRDVK